MTALVAFLVIRDGSHPVTDEAEAGRAIQALLGPVSGHARQVEGDGIGGWNVEASEEEIAHLRIWGTWWVTGPIGKVAYEVAAEMP